MTLEDPIPLKTCLSKVAADMYSFIKLRFNWLGGKYWRQPFYFKTERNWVWSLVLSRLFFSSDDPWVVSEHLSFQSVVHPTISIQLTICHYDLPILITALMFAVIIYILDRTKDRTGPDLSIHHCNTFQLPMLDLTSSHS